MKSVAPRAGETRPVGSALPVWLQRGVGGCRSWALIFCRFPVPESWRVWRGGGRISNPTSPTLLLPTLFWQPQLRGQRADELGAPPTPTCCRLGAIKRGPETRIVAAASLGSGVRAPCCQPGTGMRPGTGPGMLSRSQRPPFVRRRSSPPAKQG